MLNNEKIEKFPLESGKVYRCTHQGVKKIYSFPGQNGYEAEINAFGKLFGTADFKEGTTAFLEKRKANFSGK